ncbi:HAD family hydrolase [Spirosoma migulaei]
MNIAKENLKLIAFDADDTLWANQPLFDDVERDLRTFLAQYGTPDQLDAALIAVQSQNIALMGYGAKGFILSMIEVAILLTEGQVLGREIQQLIDQGKYLLRYRIDLLDGVEETLRQLSGAYPLMVLTKGDLLDQESKLARSGIGHYFDHVEIVSEKNELTYQQLLKRYRLQPAEFLMIGNSLKSDVLPVVNIGAHAIYVPFYTTALHEQVAVAGNGYGQIEHMSELIALLNGRQLL